MDEEMVREIAGVKRQIADLSDRLEKNSRQIMAYLARLTGEVSDIRRTMATKSELTAVRDEMNDRFDGMARQYDNLTYRAAVQKSRTDDHEKRLKKLEARH